jgi:mRNA-degrading endonuclease RelE of RelBE toxin-antitoxin system
MPYAIEIRDAAFEELQAVKPFYRAHIVDAIDTQLVHQPNVETRNRKVLTDFMPDFEHEEPIWELRVGRFRVYYDVSDDAMLVVVRAVREKPPHIATEQIT